MEQARSDFGIVASCFKCVLGTVPEELSHLKYRQVFPTSIEQLQIIVDYIFRDPFVALRKYEPYVKKFQIFILTSPQYNN